VDLCENRPLRITTNNLQYIGFCFVNVTKLTQDINVALLSFDMNTKINSKKHLILVRGAISHTVLLINASSFFKKY